MPTSKEPMQQPNPDQDQHTAGASVSTQVVNKGEEGSVESTAPSEEQAAEQARAASGTNGVVTNGHAQNGVPSTADEEETAAPQQSDDALTDNSEQTDGASPETGEHASAAQLPRSAVKIKGRPGGVSLEIGEGDWAQMLTLLAERLTAAEGFFRGGRVVLEAGDRFLDEAQLRQVRNLLEEQDMKLGVVRSTAEGTLQAAQDIGISTKNDDMEPVPEPTEPSAQPEPPVHPPIVETPLPAPPAHYVYRGSLRSGQVLRKAESVVIIGDVNPGAQVISSGDIIVWGRLRGIARAGVDGNQRAVVAALDFIPTQLRIASLTAVPPEKKQSPAIFFWRREPKRRPEIARILDGRIVVEPWDESKRNKLGAPGR